MIHEWQGNRNPFIDHPEFVGLIYDKNSRPKGAIMRLVLSAIALALAFTAYGHGGGLDANGGHHDRKNGGYHYHRSPSPPVVEKPRPLEAPPRSIESSKLLTGPKTDKEIRAYLIDQSKAAYQGSCPCPYNVDRAGRRCGKRSAYSKPGGAEPLCYESDISDETVASYRERHGISEPTNEPTTGR